jgi:hypothetical protein
MKKTAGQIEKDVYVLIKNSAVCSFISGSLYRQGMRPPNSKEEDAVVSFSTGIDGQIQEGIVILNVYVEDIVVNDCKVKNIPRCTAIEDVLNTFVESISVTENYLFKLDKMIQSFQENEIEQHFVNCRIKFKLSTF